MTAPFQKKWPLLVLAFVLLSSESMRAQGTRENIVPNNDFEIWEPATPEQLEVNKGKEFQISLLENNLVAKDFIFVCEMAGTPGVTISRDEKEHHSGTSSVRIKNTNEVHIGSVHTKPIKLEPLSKYKLSVWYRMDLEKGDVVGVWVNHGPSDNFQELNQPSFFRIPAVRKGSWKEFEVTFETGSDSDQGIFILQLQNTTGQVWFDDLSVIKTGRASKSASQN